MGKVVQTAQGPMWQRTRLEKIFLSLQLPFVVGHPVTGLCVGILGNAVLYSTIVTGYNFGVPAGIGTALLTAILFIWFCWVNLLD
ncbi:MAG TPA: hypothetical protein VHP58_05680 [Alphaproteobacteria bacterium]|nr:hypothetical protein [Alphaproteobacteria bacterium]